MICLRYPAPPVNGVKNVKVVDIPFGETAQKSPLSPVLKVLVLVIVGRFIDDK
jgi:hypothetical protein